MISDRAVEYVKSLFKNWMPRPPLTVSEWADKNRVLTTKTSSEPGLWRTDRVPYMREIMDCASDPNVEEIVIMASSQVSKTEFLLNIAGYHMDYDPTSIMYVQPDIDTAEDFSKNRVQEMIDASPTLRKIVTKAKGRASGNTIKLKEYPGGYIRIVGANSPDDLASNPIRVLLMDEIDRYPASAGKEGDPVSLAEKRTTTFWNRKIVYCSTPTIKGSSRIEELYNDSTMEVYALRCPGCGEYQQITFENIKFQYHMGGNEFVVTEVNHRCEYCGFSSGERDWKRGGGKWIARKPHSRRRGFHLNQFVSPWSSWPEIVRKFLEANRDGKEKLKTWTNTVIGETWEEEGEKLEAQSLMSRCEDYGAEVPDGVKILTAAVDVQDDRFEIEVMGWGIRKESWGIEKHVIYGDLKGDRIWNELDEYLSRTWTNQEGRNFPIAITCIDSGGHFTTKVYRFCRQREARRIFAIKGQGTENGEYIPLLNGHRRTQREHAVLFILGVDEGKNQVFDYLKSKPGQVGYCHFPDGRGYNESYFLGLTAEKKELRKKKGRDYYVWVQIRKRNEPFDLRVYNLAALEILNPKLDTLDEKSSIPAEAPKQPRKTIRKYVKRSNIW
ncbi:phage terminase large subunit family protein [Paenibacillus phocaensis]|uniref:phage terminase large subunit family protein n=1 Tax=Paenibacillus phocaensis TaxID=1776378 RepID=UPI000839D7FB|nr:phage terminase large subunit family protein [Paenibacillus phocaensis]